MKLVPCVTVRVGYDIVAKSAHISGSISKEVKSMCIECAVWVIYEFRRSLLYWEPRYGGKYMGEILLRHPSKVPLIYVDFSDAYSTCFGWESRLSGFR